MRKEISYIPIAILVMLVVSMFTAIPVSAFIHPDGTLDDNFELFGPHVDQVQFKMYATDTAMWTAMGLGEIDLCDWPLTTAWRQQFALNPDVNVVSAGGEAGMFLIDFNHDPYAIVPESTRYPYPNPVYTAPSGGYTLGIPPISTNVHFRWACLKLFNRTLFNQVLGPAGFPILTPVPSYMGGYIWSAPTPAPAPDYVAATAELNAGGIYKDPGTGDWYWDYDGSLTPHANEYKAAEVIMTWRQDAYRTQAGVQLFTELGNMGFTVTGTSVTGGQNYQQVMLDKNYHITTLGWIYIGPDPDYLYDLYHVTAFYDDADNSCANTADLNDTQTNLQAEGIKFALDGPAAVTAAIAFQQRFYAICAQIPLFSSARYGANAKYYTGGNDGVKKTPDDGENQYRLKNLLDPTSRREWLGFANVAGVGSNNWFSEVNAWPNCTVYGDGVNMTLRYGWSSQDYPKHINPFYSEWYWDSMVLGVLYDSMGYRDPYDVSQWKPDLVKNWTVGTWNDPISGLDKSKVTVTLRPDVYWSDGTPMTIADVVFSLVESTPLLIQYGNSPPWWWPTAELVKSLSIIDGYTVEILYDVASFFALGWTLGGFYIVPKHIWKPLIISGQPMNAFAPDPNFINSGPFRYLKFTPLSSLVVVAHTAGSAITTDRAGAVPITSPKGYHNYCPVYVDIHTTSPVPYATKINLPNASINSVTVDYDVTLLNKWLNSSGVFSDLEVNKTVLVDGVLQTNLKHWNVTHITGDGITDTFDMPLGGASMVPNSMTVWVNGVEKTRPTDYDVDWATGKVMFVVPPPNNQDIKFKYQYTPSTNPHILAPGVPDVESGTFTFGTGLHHIVACANITGPSMIDDIHPNPWINQTICVVLYVWVSIKEDAAGGTFYDQWYNGLRASYAYKTEVPTPDFRVSGSDVSRAKFAFGAYPGHARWDSVMDINGNYKIDGSDIALIAKKFGWPSWGWPPITPPLPIC